MRSFNDDYSKYLDLSCNYKQAGDWLFYVNVMSMGKIAFTNKVLNYYREHGINVSSSFNRNKHLNEIKSIHKYIEDNFGLDNIQRGYIEDRYEFLIEAWGLDKEMDYNRGYEDAIEDYQKYIKEVLKDSKLSDKEKEKLMNFNSK